MCVFTSIFTALGTALGAIGGAVGGGAMAGTLAVANGIGGALASVGAGVAGTVGITGLSTGAAMAVGAGTVAAVGTGLGLGIKAMTNSKNSKSSGGLSISSDALKAQPTSLTDTVSKSADKMVDTNRKSNPLSSLRIKRTMNNKQETGINIANDSGTGLNLGG